jgi:uncharacterized repeat protein (TIGR01451 family)
MMYKFKKAACLALAVIFLMQFAIDFPGVTASAEATSPPLTIGMTVNTSQVFSGDEFVYTIQYANPGNSATETRGMTITDVLPAGVQYISNTKSADVESVGTAANSEGRMVVTFNFKDPLPVGRTGIVTISVRFPNGKTPDGTVVSNMATIADLTDNPVDSNIVQVTSALKAPNWNIAKSQVIPGGSPALDQPVTYELNLSGNSGSGQLDLHDCTVETAFRQMRSIFQLITADSGDALLMNWSRRAGGWQVRFHSASAR